MDYKPQTSALPFYARKLWVDFKKTANLSIRGDKRHMCDRIVRGFQSGQISADSWLGASIRRDGLGSQILSRLSIQATAAALGVNYVHVPFEIVSHAEGDPADWTERCEKHFHLSTLCHHTECALPRVGLFDFAKDKKIWPVPHLIQVPHMYAFTDRHPDAFRMILQPERRLLMKTVKVAVHVRRGDVSNQQNSERFVTENHIIKQIQDLRQVLLANGLEPQICLYSNGTPEEFESIAAEGVETALDLSAFETMRRLIDSDVLLMGKSTFSFVAGLFHGGLAIYDDFARAPLSEWVRITKGHIDVGEVHKRLELHLGAKT